MEKRRGRRENKNQRMEVMDNIKDFKKNVLQRRNQASHENLCGAARAWRPHAVALAACERHKVRERIAKAAGKRRRTASLAVFLETETWKWSK